jgi:hypothetical protein
MAEKAHMPMLMDAECYGRGMSRGGEEAAHGRRSGFCRLCKSVYLISIVAYTPERPITVDFLTPVII